MKQLSSFLRSFNSKVNATDDNNNNSLKNKLLYDSNALSHTVENTSENE